MIIRNRKETDQGPCTGFGTLQVGTREAPQPVQQELPTIRAWITVLDLVGFGQLGRRIDEQLDLLFISGKHI